MMYIDLSVGFKIITLFYIDVFLCLETNPNGKSKIKNYQYQ